jgi:DNA-binding transcriptional regulator YiaG
VSHIPPHRYFLLLPLKRRLDIYRGTLENIKRTVRSQSTDSDPISTAVDCFHENLKKESWIENYDKKKGVKLHKEFRKNIMGGSTTFDELKRIRSELHESFQELAATLSIIDHTCRVQASSQKVEYENSGYAPQHAAPGQNDIRHRPTDHAGPSPAPTKFTEELPLGWEIKTYCAKCGLPILRPKGGNDITPHAYQHDNRTVHILPGTTVGCDAACKEAKKKLENLGKGQRVSPPQQGNHAKTEADETSRWKKEEEEAGGKDGGKNQETALKEKSEEPEFRQGVNAQERAKDKALDKGLIAKGYFHGTTIDDEKREKVSIR